MFDIVLENGLVVDGTGAPAVPATVGIRGGRIAYVGAGRGLRTRRAIDVDGRMIAPGFIDVHTHDDRAVLDDPAMPAKVSQGVTTVVVGNCGVSLAPFASNGRELVAPLTILGDPDVFRFRRFRDYVVAVEQARPAVNVVALVGHTTLRASVMDRFDRPATADEIAAMAEGLDDAMHDGASGLSTGLFYAGARQAPTEEVIALAKVVARHQGLYATHMRDEAAGVLDSVEETLTIGRAADIPVVISHHKIAGAENWGLSTRTLARISKAMSHQPVMLDLYPYAAASTVLLPERCNGSMRVQLSWSEPHPEQAGRDIADIARDWGCSGEEAAKRLLPGGAIYFMMDEGDIKRILAFPHTMIGSDGLPHDRHPHPRLWGSFPRVLGHYARDEQVISIEEAVRRMTGLAAMNFGLAGRGLIREGHVADITVFDPASVKDLATFDAPEQPSAGIHLVLVNGKTTWGDHDAEPARAGSFLRRSVETS